MLFQLGGVTFDTYPLNADETNETFGDDFAVKPVVGAQQPREFMGPADHNFTLSGELQPYFLARNGQDSGMGDLAALKAMADGGEPQILVRGDGTNMGWWLIEKGSLKSDPAQPAGHRQRHPPQRRSGREPDRGLAGLADVAADVAVRLTRSRAWRPRS